jgi:alkyldihydroxyacetonephosphate synthase
MAGQHMTRRRSFYGWGYEGEAVGKDELRWFEGAWSGLFGVDGFTPAPMPVESDISLRAPREHAIARGVMRDTVESCITWDRYMDFQAHVKKKTLEAIREVTGRPGTCTVRFTHLYPDGPAPYFTWHALGDKAKLVEQFWAIKAASSQAMSEAGGTITHHHALGRDHRTWYDMERPELFADALRAVKARLDPKHVMNPGVLVD